MSIGRKTDYSFRPHRGKESTILNPVTEHSKGNMYYATDTHRMYFDMDDNQCQGVRGEGIAFIYGDAYKEEDAPEGNTDTYFISEVSGEVGYFLYPRNKISGHYNLYDIIINTPNNTFYKIINITKEEYYVICEEMMVAGSGGGGWQGLRLNEVTAFPRIVAYNKDPIVGVYIPVASDGRTGTCDIEVNIYREKNAVQPAWGATFPADFKKPCTITIPVEQIAPGNQNHIRMVLRSVTGEASATYTCSVNAVDLTFALDLSRWNHSTPFSVNKPLIVPWRITSSTPNDIPAGLKVQLTWSMGGKDYEPETMDLKLNSSSTSTSFQEDGLKLEHGTYRVRGNAKVEIRNVWVDIGTIDIEFAWLDVSLLAPTPLIWSNYPDPAIEEKYTIINIPYYVYDPVMSSQNKPSEIIYVANNEVITEEPLLIYTADNNSATWEITDYLVGENNFRILCRDAAKNFSITIVEDPDNQLEPVTDGCKLHLTSKGRSNNESATARATWKNKITNLSSTDFTYTAIPRLENFNWYNNGWMKDSDNNSVLRLSNGAKVVIPLRDLRSATNRTYEFDFKVHNTVNYSKLINLSTALNDKGEEIVVKTVSDGQGAFLTYWDQQQSQGYMLGTQEAFFAYGATDITNVRYADDTRVKISFVVRYTDGGVTAEGVKIPKEKYIYTYINGVLSAAYGINGETSVLSSTAQSLIINSDYCDVDIYNIRIYDQALDYGGIVTNWIGDASDLKTKLARKERNDIVSGSGVLSTIDYQAVRNARLIPVMVITTYGDGTGGDEDLLPFAKGNKRMCAIRYYDPHNVEKNFHAYNCEIDVQGTSSQGYPRRNYKIKTKQYDEKLPFYFEKWDGVEANKDIWVSYQDGATTKPLKKWDLGHGMPERVFCLKADYMESSGTHNTGLANLVADIQSKYVKGDVYDFRHPLARMYGEYYARTTIYGYPILVFHEQKVIDANGQESTPIKFVGKYNFNIDKGATDSFGFTYGEWNESSEAIYPEYIEYSTGVVGPVELVTDATTHEYKRDADGNLLYYDYEGTKEQNVKVEKTLKDFKGNAIAELARGSYAEVAECWELKDNQPGPGKFQEQEGGFYATPGEGEKIIAAKDFEMRYHYADFDDPYEATKDKVKSNELFTKYTINLAKMLEWVASTDVSANALSLQAQGKGHLGQTLSEPKFYRTRDTGYVVDHEYYIDEQGQTQWSPERQDAITFFDDEVLVNATTLINWLKAQSNAEYGDYAFEYNYNKETKIGTWQLKYITSEDTAINISSTLTEIASLGITIPAAWEAPYPTLSFTWSNKVVNWSIALYQKHTIDTVEYRLAKFRNEFTQHFNLAHVLFYYIMTEVLLLYDSRQKNMMLASWGPEIPGGEYIWYPIFYDMDTQLGINNSGQVYWDYDTDATPKDNPDASIFSGTGSVLWANVSTCFDEEIKQAYRLLRKYSDRLSQGTLEKAYNANQSQKWSEYMKNIDAFYKYIAPTSKEDYGGFINTKGEIDEDGTYIYCLQGDRELNRSAFFRNRLNFKDSEWLGGSYTSSGELSTSITMRYNLNDRAGTSDDANDITTGALFNGTPDFKITPFLTQYTSVGYDSISTTPQKFDIANMDKENPESMYSLVEAPITIRSRANAGVALTQQLAYVYGPEYISDLGDLSDKYLNLFQSGSAIRLRNLQLGNDKPGYKNENLKDLDATENGSGKAKKLLQTLDYSNLTSLTGRYDVSGCIKLKTLKLLGTNFTGILLPAGNVLEKAYLPATIASINLVSPLSLTNIIENRDLVSWVETEVDGKTTWVHNNVDGLYIENLTDKLNDEIDLSTAYTKIQEYQIDDSKMGYDTYRMLEYLYRIKCAAQTGELTTTDSTKQTSPMLRLQAKGVQWSPYVKCDVDELQKTDAVNYYYTLNDRMTFVPYTGNNWTEDLKNIGIYKRIYEENSPVKDLSMLDRFIRDFDDVNCQPEVGDGTSVYYFRSTVIDPNYPKLLPVITGNLHVDNDATTPVKEIDLANKYGTDKHYNELMITANYIDPCYRAKFIEYNDNGLTTHYVQRSERANTMAEYNGDIPMRVYHDFLGWSLNVDKMKETGSIGTEEDLIYDAAGHLVNATQHPVLTKDYQDENGNWVENTLTLVAVFRLTKYKIYFVDGNGNNMKFTNSNNEIVDYKEFSTIEPIVPPIEVPYKNDLDLTPMNMCYNFIGWGEAFEAEKLVTFGKIYPTRDYVYYAIFEKRDIYETPVPLEQLWYQEVEDGVEIALKPAYKRTGKICLPKQLQINGVTKDVVGILGNTFVDANTKEGSDFVLNTRLTHVFLQGTPDNTCKIKSIGQKAFSMERPGETALEGSLMHIDIPSSLRNIALKAFYYCDRLKVLNLKNVTTFGSHCLSNVGSKADITPEDMLYISGDVTHIASEAFRYSKWWKIQLGSAAKPIASLTALARQASQVFEMDFLTSGEIATVYLFTTMDESTAMEQFAGIQGSSNATELVVTIV